MLRQSRIRRSSAHARRGHSRARSLTLDPALGLRVPYPLSDCRRGMPARDSAGRDKLGLDMSSPVIKHDKRSRRRANGARPSERTTKCEHRSWACSAPSPSRSPAPPRRRPTAQARRHPAVRHQRRDPALRLPRQRHLRHAAFQRAVLFDAAALQPSEISRRGRRSRRIVDGRARPHDLHVQAPPGREIPRRHDAHLERREGHL